jgi:hypothetical protein
MLMAPIYRPSLERGRQHKKYDEWNAGLNQQLAFPAVKEGRPDRERIENTLKAAVN